MKHNLTRLSTALAALSLWAAMTCAAPPLDLSDGKGQRESAGVFETPLTLENLDAAAFAAWVDGAEKPMEKPSQVISTKTTAPEGVSFGDSEKSGIRHMRIGWKTPLTVGTVLVRGNVRVSALKAEAAYPGNMANEGEWISAVRLKGGDVSRDEAAPENCVVWVLPPNTATRALRFTHTAAAGDGSRAVWIGGIYIISERFANIAKQAIAPARLAALKCRRGHAIFLLLSVLAWNSHFSAFAAEPSIPTNGLLLWLNADAGVQSKDGTVVGWQDSSAAGYRAERDVAFSTRAENPRLVPDAANGHAVLRFDGSDAAFSFPRLKNIQTVFWVVAKDAKSFGQHNERFVLGDSTGKEFHVGTHKTAFILNPGEASPALREGVVRVDGRVVNPLTTDFPDRLAVISMVATGYVPANQISKDRQFKDRSWQGDIAEIILYSRALPDAEREQVEKQLATKYRISAVPVPPAPGNAGKKSDAAQWPRWRGPHGDGISGTSHIPIKWSNEEHVAWQADVEGAGNSSPCIWGDRIFLTSALGGKTTPTATLALCFDRASGKPLWRTEVPLPAGPLKAPSEDNGWATPTAATDGEHIVVVFATGMVACLSPNGKILWTYDLGPLDHLWGLASSPVIEGHRVFYSVDQGKHSRQSSFLVALDLATGRVEWREPIPTSGERGYSTPLLFGENPRQLLLWAGNKLSAFDPANGAARWSQDVFRLGEPITTPIQAGAKGIFIAQSDHAMALEVGAEGAKSLWSIDRSTGAQIARIANNLVYRDRLYAVSDARQLSCYDVTNGRRVWSAEIDDKFYAAPVAAAGHVIFTGRSGKFYVLNAGDEFQLAATNTLGWPCDASPAIMDGCLYFRTKQGAAKTSLWCVADMK